MTTPSRFRISKIKKNANAEHLVAIISEMEFISFYNYHLAVAIDKKGTYFQTMQANREVLIYQYFKKYGKCNCTEISKPK